MSLIVALDVPTVAQAEQLVDRLGDVVKVYKIGYQLAFAGGLDLAKTLVSGGKQVFLDLKLHDISNTVSRGVESVAKLGVSFLSVHAYPQTMHAAVKASAGSQLRILAVTVLTSYSDADLWAAGYSARSTVAGLVAERGLLALSIGVDGLVCSAYEAAWLRMNLGRGMLLVTPGIRPPGVAADDQKRIMTVPDAIKAGADYLVVGRPIVNAADPRELAEAIQSQCDGAKRDL